MTPMTDSSPNALAVSMRHVRPLLEQAETAGLDVGHVIETLDLAPDIARQPETHLVSLADYFRLQNRLALLFGDETCHLSERQLLTGSTDFVLRHVGECENLLEAMRVIAESYNMLHGGEYNYVQVRKNAVDYVIDDRTFPYTISQDADNIYFSIESTLIFLHCMLMTIAPETAGDAVQSLAIRRPKYDEDCQHLSYWQVPIRFGAERYDISFDPELVQKPIATPSPSSLTSRAVQQRILEAVAHARPPSSVSTTSGLVHRALKDGVIEQQAIASQLGISVATLRRRLTDEGISFRDLRRDVLNATAKELLQEQKSVSQVAEALGFAEFRSFVRAFKSWNGMTPAAYQRQLD